MTTDLFHARLLALAAPSDLTSSCLLSGIIGLVAHGGYFIRGWRSPDAPAFILLHAVIFSLMGLRLLVSHGAMHGSMWTAAVISSYLVALFTSMVVYRLFFHRLNRFKGPTMAKASKWYTAYMNRNKAFHVEFQRLHDTYGDTVRVGPNDLSIATVEVIDAVHGGRSKVTKNQIDTYEFLHYRGHWNLDSMSNVLAHKARRQIWDKALSPNAMQGYEPKIRDTAHRWLAKIADHNGTPVNTTLYSSLVSLEGMGQIGFSKRFGVIEEGKPNKMLELLGATFGMAAPLGFVAWPLALVKALPPFGLQKEFEELGVEMIDEREANDTPEHNDVVKHFLEDYRAENPKSFVHRDILYTDSQAVLIGATDTIAAALGFAFYYLAKNPAIQQNLRDATAPFYGKVEPHEFAASDLLSIPFLDAVINETLRLHPSATTTVGRMTPPEGLVVGKDFIPGGVHIVTPLPVIQTSPKYFRDPLSFIPERFTTRPELIIDKRAFSPFLKGRRDCVGKRLAYLSMRVILAYTVQEYKFQFAEGEDGRRVFREAKNHFINSPGALELVFEKMTG